MAEPEIQAEILEDGTIKITTSKVSAAIHLSADQLLADVTALSGGQVERKARTKQAHTHHGHSHNLEAR